MSVFACACIEPQTPLLLSARLYYSNTSGSGCHLSDASKLTAKVATSKTVWIIEINIVIINTIIVVFLSIHLYCKSLWYRQVFVTRERFYFHSWFFPSSFISRQFQECGLLIRHTSGLISELNYPFTIIHPFSTVDIFRYLSIVCRWVNL